MGWIGCCSNRFLPQLNLLWGWKMGHRRLVCRRPLRVALCGFFLLWSDVAYYAAVGELSVLGNLVTVDEETRICSLDIFDSLE